MKTDGRGRPSYVLQRAVSPVVLYDLVVTSLASQTLVIGRADSHRIPRNSNQTNAVDNPFGARHFVASEDRSRVNSLAELASARVKSLFGGRKKSIRGIAMLLNNKIAVIYGAGGPIGGAVARAFAREGAKVFLTGRTLAKLTKLAKEITVAGGVAQTARVDAFDEKAVEKHAAAVVAQSGVIDVSFNAVGIVGSIQATPLIELSADDISLPVKNRVATNFLTAQVAARHMLTKRSGVILMITATPARMAWPLTGSFGIEGAAIEGLCRSLASELSPQGVRVICLRSAGSPESFPDAPGKTREEITAMLAERTLLGRPPLLAEVGNVAAFMASDYASPMTATVANITCGTIVD